MKTTCLLPCLLLPASLTAQSYTLSGEGCNGGPIANTIVQNDVNPALRIQSLPNEYAYAAKNTATGTIWVVGFELFTSTVAATPSTVLSGIYLDNGGATATTHTFPALNPAATGHLTVPGTTAAWYSTSVYPPVAIAPNVAFWLGAEAITGSAAVTLNVPNNATLTGFTFYDQWATIAPGVNTLSMLVSNYGIGVVGP